MAFRIRSSSEQAPLLLRILCGEKGASGWCAREKIPGAHDRPDLRTQMVPVAILAPAATLARLSRPLIPP
eukprot:970986-Pleurochrysis_carterae.AAC.3